MATAKAVLFLAIIGMSAAALPSDRSDAQSKPHIILIVADDLGWHDVSWHNPQAKTPHLEELARGGVLLNQSYVQPICTPTRSALLSGRYPYTIGRQHGVLWPEEPTGLSIKRKLLPQALKDAGYSTHAVGKWHLGFCSWDYTPTSRGFDTFWGYYTGAEDYYHHTRGYSLSTDDFPSFYDNNHHPKEVCENDTAIPYGYDFRNNTLADYSVNGEYSTYLFSSYIKNMLETRDPSDPMFLYLPFQSVHAPLQVPQNYTQPFAHIKSHERRVKLGMVYAMDEAVGHIVEALKESGHYNNSVIVFTTDNGGPTVSAGNNWPLRGNKTTLWEGGTRGAAFVHSPLLPHKGIVSNKLIHVTDWFSTLAGLGGGVAPEDTDGYDQWEALATSVPSPRKEMIYNIDITNEMNAGIRMGDYKLLVGDPGPGEWTPPPEGHLTTILKDYYKQIGIMETNMTDSEYSNSVDPGELISSDVEEEHDRPMGIRRREKRASAPFFITAESGKSDTDTESGDEKNVDIVDDVLPVEADIQASASLSFHEDHNENVVEESEFVTLRDLGLDIYQYPGLGQLLTNGTTLRLYNLKDDPEERNDLASDETDVVKTLLGLLHYYTRDYVPPDILPNDPHANPKHWNNTWTPGWCHAK